MLMTPFIKKLINNFKFCSNFTYEFEKSRRPCLSTTKEGFCIKYPWSLLRPKEIVVSWADVKEIGVQLRDCFTGHYLFLIFVTRSNKRVVVDEGLNGWDVLYCEVLKHFPDFCVENFEKAKEWSIQDDYLICWKKSR